MYFDSRSFAYDKRDITGFPALTPVGWFLSGLVLWVLAFPLYLVSRTQLRAAGERRVATLTAEGRYTPEPQFAAGHMAARLAALAVALLFASQGCDRLSLGAGIAPCHSPKIRELVKKIVARSMDDVVFSEFGEVAAETTSDVRVCRVHVTAPSGDEGWLSFTVERYDDDRPWVEVKRTELSPRASRELSGHTLRSCWVRLSTRGNLAA